MEQKIGYKGTDENLKCRETQFELGKTYYLDEKDEIKELPEGYSIIKNKVKLCSKEAIHYCNELEKVFGFYANNGKNRFFKVEILGEFEDHSDKSGARCIKFLEEISAEEINKQQKEKQEEQQDRKMNLEVVRILQEQNPNLIVGGSISLYLQGVRLERFKTDWQSVDYDFILPYYQFLNHPKEIEISVGEEMSSGCDYSENLIISGTKADIRIDPSMRYEVLEYKGFSYKVVPLITILEAKIRYCKGKNAEKHRNDIYEMILNENKLKF